MTDAVHSNRDKPQERDQPELTMPDAPNVPEGETPGQPEDSDKATSEKAKPETSPSKTS